MNLKTEQLSFSSFRRACFVPHPPPPARTYVCAYVCVYGSVMEVDHKQRKNKVRWLPTAYQTRGGRNQKIGEHPLRPGDVFQLGDTKIRFALEAQEDETTLGAGLRNPPPAKTPKRLERG